MRRTSWETRKSNNRVPGGRPGKLVKQAQVIPPSDWVSSQRITVRKKTRGFQQLVRRCRNAGPKNALKAHGQSKGTSGREGSPTEGVGTRKREKSQQTKEKQPDARKNCSQAKENPESTK